MMKYITYIIIILLLFSCKSRQKSSNQKEEQYTTQDSSYILSNGFNSIYIEETVKFKNYRNHDDGNMMDDNLMYDEDIENVENNLTDNSLIDNNIIKTSIQKEKENYNKIIYETSTIGDINYIMNDTMILNKPSIVNLTISNNINRDDIISEIETFTEYNIHTQIIRISPIMYVSLIDPNDNNFKIINITREEQILEKDHFTKWEWEVTPLKKGKNRLKLSVNIVYDNIPKNIKVYEDFIYVYSDQTTWNKIISFIISYWQWLISTLIIPVIIWVRNKKMKKSKVG